MPNTSVLVPGDKRTKEFLSRAHGYVQVAKDAGLPFNDQLQEAVDFMEIHSQGSSPLSFRVLQASFNRHCGREAQRWINCFKRELVYCTTLPANCPPGDHS